MAIAGFKLRVNGGAYVDTIVDVGLVFERLFSSLAPSTEYSFEIRSYDDDGLESEWSAPVSATTDAAPELHMVVDESGVGLVDPTTGEALTEFI